MDAEKIKEYHQKGIWVTANETLIHVADMETSHLVNVAKMLLRHAVQYVAITLENSIADGFAFVDLLQGEMAQETVLNTLTDFEQNFDEQEVFKEYLLEHPFWKYVVSELRNRKSRTEFTHLKKQLDDFVYSLSDNFYTIPFRVSISVSKGEDRNAASQAG